MGPWRKPQARYGRGVLSPSVHFAGALIVWFASQGDVAEEVPVDYGREIQPLLADRCFACHGPDAASRAQDLRLDTRQGALRDLGGYAAIVPGDPEASELIARVSSELEFEVMPPPEAHKESLNAEEVALFSRWIEEGANWSEHWAFVAPVKAPLTGAAPHPVDEFVMRRLAPLGLTLSPPADARALARRLSLDLVGLPPPLAKLTELAAADEREALDRWVDELLASPAHAERLAMWWLDAARYADTDGFQQDERRTNWPWRDWVVRAFAANMPFDRFTELQFAGDLVEGASPETILATCFHRNHMHNGEGGRDPAESRVDYVRDRTNTMGAVWLGLTLECAQCHDHKFDPVSQADYYSFSAFFDSIDESGRAGGGAGPFLEYTPEGLEDQRESARLEHFASIRELAGVESSLESSWERWLGEKAELIESGHSAWTALPVLSVVAASGESMESTGPGEVRRTGGKSNQDEYVMVLGSAGLAGVTGFEIEILPGETLGAGPKGEFVLTGVYLRALSVDAQTEAEITHAVANVEASQKGRAYGRVGGSLGDDPRSGWSTEGQDVEGSAVARFALPEMLPLEPGDRIQLEIHFRSEVPSGYARHLKVRFTDEAGPAARRLGPTPFELLAAASGTETLKPDARDDLREAFLEQQQPWVRARNSVKRFEAQLAELESALGPQKVTVLKERAAPRKTFVLERGDWDKHGDEVEPRFPSAIPVPGNMAASDARLTRLDLARWLMSPEHPLTSRVIVNQVWQMFFGRGLVATPADFGLQGSLPTHPELLDWLSADFIESGWDLRRLVRLIVTSQTYRQSSRMTADQYAADPDNELLARGARFRMPSWMIRDVALSVSGLLDPARGGPPVYPHQPVGVWEELFMGRFTYPSTVGRRQYRRSLYAFWRRNSAPTFFFDQADRRTCAVDRRETNTPLQALTLLNDRTYLDAALALGRWAYRTSEMDREACLQALGERILGRPISESEQATLGRLYDQALAEFESDLPRAEALVTVNPLGPPVQVVGSLFVSPNAHVAPRVAATATVAAVLLNTDEVMTRE